MKCQDMSCRDWAKEFWYAVEWRPPALPAAESHPSGAAATLIIGGGDLVNLFQQGLPDSMVAVSAGHPQISENVIAVDFGSTEQLSTALRHKSWAAIVFAEAVIAEDASLEGHTLTLLLKVLQVFSIQSIHAFSKA